MQAGLDEYGRCRIRLFDEVRFERQEDISWPHVSRTDRLPTGVADGRQRSGSVLVDANGRFDSGHGDRSGFSWTRLPQCLDVASAQMSYTSHELQTPDADRKSVVEGKGE